MTATDQPEPVSDTKGNIIVAAVVAYYAPTVIAFGDAGYTLFHQLRDWLKTGVWVSHDLWESCAYWLSFTERPHLTWVVPDHIMWWIFGSSRWFSMTVIGALLLALETWAFIAMAGAIESARLAKRQKASRSD